MPPLLSTLRINHPATPLCVHACVSTHADQIPAAASACCCPCTACVPSREGCASVQRELDPGICEAEVPPVFALKEILSKDVFFPDDPKASLTRCLPLNEPALQFIHHHRNIAQVKAPLRTDATPPFWGEPLSCSHCRRDVLLPGRRVPCRRRLNLGDMPPRAVPAASTP